MLLTSEFFVRGSGSMPQSAVPQSGHKPTVLVVDDDPTVVALCRNILQQAGCSVLSASGSSEALKLCKGHTGPIDVLVTDLVLAPPEFAFASSGNEFPHVHGHELAFRALRMRADLRVILMSGNIEQELAAYGIRKGTLPFLAKPFNSSALMSMITTILEAPPPTPESLQKDQSSGVKPTDEWFD
jgi:CheY-like chemotaxis protein